MICEDAPCCGCCGPAVWASEAISDEEWRYEREWLDEANNYYDGYDGDDYCKGCGADDLDECTCDDDNDEDVEDE